MPIARFEMPDGRIARFEVPEGTTPEQAQAMMAEQVAQMPEEQPSQFSLNPERVQQVKQAVGDAMAGAVRGVGSIGSTILAPYDIAKDALAGKGFTLESNLQRRGDIDAGLQSLGADPESLAYKGGKFAGEVAGTAGVGGALARGVGAVSQSPKALQLAEALRTGGMTSGPMATRVGGGAVTGAAMAGMVNPEDAATGAVVGGALPVAGKALKTGAQTLMQSAIKPTIKQLRTGDAKVAVDTLLDYGISPTAKGVEKLRLKVGDINDVIAEKLAGSNASVNRRAVLNYLNDVRGKFGTQVSPTNDLNAIQGVADDFMAHPALTGNKIPVQLAQKLKQGTYKTLAGKYGEVGSASTEAQKALARGLKDKIADAVPGIGELNAEEARLLKTLDVAERRALMELNKNPVGLAALAGNPVGFAAFMADRSAAFKALAARLANRASGSLNNPAVRAGAVATQSD